jgi:hypothetical protein
MAGRIANTYQNGFIFCAGFFQGFLSPWIPVYRVVSVLEQIRTATVDQSVGSLVRVW